MEFPGDRLQLRIGELGQRLGVSDHVLRAWENRYGLLRPVRSSGCFRLYSEAGVWRLRRMEETRQLQAELARLRELAGEQPAARQARKPRPRPAGP
jgi:MerR family transcriptional regulator, light-induced transcriptional regulator